MAQSEQEAALQAFMSNSLGPSRMFHPSDFPKGPGQREPADLAFVNDGLVVLFYAKSNGGKLEEQVNGNFRQASGYLRQWKGGLPKHTLKGFTTSGARAYVPFKKVEHLVIVSVVSCRCGISLRPAEVGSPPGVRIVVPDVMFFWLAQFGGSIVDFLAICLCSVTPNDDDPVEVQYERIGLVLDQYAKDAHQTAFKFAESTFGKISSLGNIEFIKQKLDQFFSAISITAPGNPKTPAGCRIFGDLSLQQSLSLALIADNIIHASGENFERYCIGMASPGNYKFIFSTVNLFARNNKKVMEEILAIQAKEPEAVIVMYMLIPDQSDPRAPSLIALPSQLPPMQASAFVRELCALASIKLSR